MATQPTADEIRAFAQRHDLTEDQARQLFVEHGPDEDRLSKALDNLRHFLKAPS